MNFQPGRRVLDHVGGINPPLEPAVRAQCHHAPQPLAMLRQQRADRRAVTPRGRLRNRDTRRTIDDHSSRTWSRITTGLKSNWFPARLSKYEASGTVESEDDHEGECVEEVPEGGIP
jgi:hypothetical protein